MEESKPQVTEVQENIQQSVEQKPEIPQEENINEINWKRFREKQKQERQERAAIEKKAQEKEQEAAALKAAMEALMQPNPKSEDGEETEDQRIAKIVKATLNSEMQRVEAERMKKEAAQLPHKLSQLHPDFDKVCTEENLDYLKFHYPEVEKALSYAPEGVEKWSDVYRAVKRLVPNIMSKKDEAKIEKNLAKPRSISSGLSNTGDSAPVYLDDARKEANWQRMQRAMKGV
jgi:predicted nuclease with TOPRIM domain